MSGNINNSLYSSYHYSGFTPSFTRPVTSVDEAAAFPSLAVVFRDIQVFLIMPRIFIASIDENKRKLIVNALRNHPQKNQFLKEPLMNTEGAFEILSSYKDVLDAISEGYQQFSRKDQIRLRGGFLRYILTNWFQAYYRNLYPNKPIVSFIPDLPPDIDFFMDASDTSPDMVHQFENFLFRPLAQYLSKDKPELYECYFILLTICYSPHRRVEANYILTKLSCKNAPDLEFVISWKELSRYSLGRLDKLSLHMRTNVFYCGNELATVQSIREVMEDNVERRIVIEKPETLDGLGLARVLSHEASGISLDDKEIFSKIYEGRRQKALLTKSCLVTNLSNKVERCCRIHLANSQRHLAAMFWNLYIFSGASEPKYRDKALEHSCGLGFQKDCPVSTLQNWILEELVKTESPLMIEWGGDWIRVCEQGVFWYLRSYVPQDSQILSLLQNARHKLPSNFFTTFFSPQFNPELPIPVALIQEQNRKWYKHAVDMFDALPAEQRSMTADLMIAHGHPLSIDNLIAVYQLCEPNAKRFFALTRKVQSIARNTNTSLQVDHLCELASSLSKKDFSESCVEACEWLLEKASENEARRAYHAFRKKGYLPETNKFTAKFEESVPLESLEPLALIQDTRFEDLHSTRKVTLLFDGILREGTVYADHLFHKLFTSGIIDRNDSRLLFQKLIPNFSFTITGWFEELIDLKLFKILPRRAAYPLAGKAEYLSHLLQSRVGPSSELHDCLKRNQNVIEKNIKDLYMDLVPFIQDLCKEGFHTQAHEWMELCLRSRVKRNVFDSVVPFLNLDGLCLLYPRNQTIPLHAFRMLPRRLARASLSAFKVDTDHLEHLLSDLSDPQALHAVLVHRASLIEKNFHSLIKPIVLLQVELLNLNEEKCALFWLNLILKKKFSVTKSLREALVRAYKLESKNEVEIALHPCLHLFDRGERLVYFIELFTVYQKSADRLLAAARSVLVPEDVRSLFHELAPDLSVEDDACVLECFPNQQIPLETFKKLSPAAGFRASRMLRLDVDHVQHLAKQTVSLDELQGLFYGQLALVTRNAAVFADEMVNLSARLASSGRMEEMQTWIQILSAVQLSDESRDKLLRSRRFSEMSLETLLEDSMLPLLEASARDSLLQNAFVHQIPNPADELFCKAFISRGMSKEAARRLFGQLSFSFEQPKWINDLFDDVESIPHHTQRKLFDAMVRNRSYVEAVPLAIALPDLSYDLLQPFFDESLVSARDKIRLIQRHKLSNASIWNNVAVTCGGEPGAAKLILDSGVENAPRIALNLLDGHLHVLKQATKEFLAKDSLLFEDCAAIMHANPSQVKDSQKNILLERASAYFIGAQKVEMAHVCTEIFETNPSLIEKFIIILTHPRLNSGIHDFALRLVWSLQEKPFYWKLLDVVIAKATLWTDKEIHDDLLFLLVSDMMKSPLFGENMFNRVQILMAIPTPKMSLFTGLILSTYGPENKDLLPNWADFIAQWFSSYLVDVSLNDLNVEEVGVIKTLIQHPSLVTLPDHSAQVKISKVFCDAVKNQKGNGYPIWFAVLCIDHFLVSATKLHKNPQVFKEAALVGIDLMTSLLISHHPHLFAMRVHAFFDHFLNSKPATAHSVEREFESLEEIKAFRNTRSKRVEKELPLRVIMLQQGRFIGITPDCIERRARDVELKATFIYGIIGCLAHVEGVDVYLQLLDVIEHLLSILINDYPEQSKILMEAVHRYVFSLTPQHLPQLNIVLRTRTADFVSSKIPSIHCGTSSDLAMQILFYFNREFADNRSKAERCSIVRNLIFKAITLNHPYWICEGLDMLDDYLKIVKDLPIKVEQYIFACKIFQNAAEGLGEAKHPLLGLGEVAFCNVVDRFVASPIFLSKECPEFVSKALVAIVQCGVKQLNLFGGLSAQHQIFQSLVQLLYKFYQRDKNPVFLEFYFRTFELLAEIPNNKVLVADLWMTFLVHLNIELPEGEYPNKRIEILKSVVSILRSRPEGTKHLAKIKAFVGKNWFAHVPNGSEIATELFKVDR